MATAINRSALRKNNSATLLKKVQTAAKAKTGGGQGKDPRFWEPTLDANGNGFAVIRFLPSKTEEGLPFVKVYSHGFQVGSKWFIDNCPTTLGLECPVCDSNSEHWNSGFEADKQVARSRKRNMRYISNIIVIKDPKNPENEGKNFLYSYGKKIFDKVEAAMNPPEEYGEQPRDPFGFFDGAVLKLKIKKVEKHNNYDDSVVEAASDLFDGDEDKLTALLEKLHALEEFVDPKEFKSYDDLKTAFDRAVGVKPKQDKHTEESDATYQGHAESASEYGAGARSESKAETPAAPLATPSDDGDDDLAFFQKLAQD